MNLRLTAAVLAVVALASCARGAQRKEVSFKRGGYLTEFHDRHRGAYRIGAAIHIAHGLQHDVLLLNSFPDHASTDGKFDRDMVAQVKKPPRLKPHQDSSRRTRPR